MAERLLLRELLLIKELVKQYAQKLAFSIHKFN